MEHTGTYVELYQDIEESIRTAEGEWWIEKSGALTINTYPSRDPSKRNNGGEYDYYRSYDPSGLSIRRWDSWSCDFARYETPDEKEFDVCIGSEGLEKLARLASIREAARAVLRLEKGALVRFTTLARPLFA